MKRIHEFTVVFLLLTFFVFLSIGSSLSESLTFDEIVNIQEGLNNIRNRTFTIEPYNPPLIRELTTIPILLGIGKNAGTSSWEYFPSRLVILVMALGLLLTVFLTVRFLFGITQGMLAMTILVFDPAILANSHYITPDMGLTFLFFLSFALFLQFLYRPTWFSSMVFGAVFGLACATKIPALFWGPIIMFATVIIFKKLPGFRRHFLKGVVSLCLAAVTIWGTYWFQWKPILVKHDNPNRLSNQIITFSTQYNIPFIASGIRALYNTPVPLGEYIGIVKNNVLRARQTNKDFFIGQYYSPASWYFLPVNWILKTPLPFIVLLSISVYQFIKLRPQKRSPYMKLFFTICILLVALSIVSKMSSLIRYVLPLSPFLAVVASGSLSFFSKNRKIVLILLLVWHIGSTLLAFPHFISYANELSSPYKYQWFTDSNIDWGQGLLSFNAFINQKRPSQIQLSYFGRDNADRYGFKSDKPWGSHKNNEICEFHIVRYPHYTGPEVVAISITNWNGCGYRKMPEFQPDKIQQIVGESILVFSQ